MFYLIARNEYGKSPFVSYIWTTFSFRFRMFYQFLLPGRSVNREIIKEYIKLAIEHPYKSFGMGYLKALTVFIPTLSMSVYYERIIGLFYDIKLFYDMKTKDPTILDPNPNSNAFRDDFDLDATIDKYLDMI